MAFDWSGLEEDTAAPSEKKKEFDWSGLEDSAPVEAAPTQPQGFNWDGLDVSQFDESQYSPEQLAAEQTRKQTGKRKQFDDPAQFDATAPGAQVIYEPTGTMTQQQANQQLNVGPVADAAMGAMQGFQSFIPGTDRTNLPAYGQSGVLPFVSNTLSGIGRGVAAFTAAGPVGLAADRVSQIENENEGGIVGKAMEHPVWTGLDVALSSIPGVTGAGSIKPLAADMASGFGQGFSQGMEENQGVVGSIKQGLTNTFLPAGVHGVKAVKSSLFPKSKLAVQEKPTIDTGVDPNAISSAERQIESEMTPAELYNQPLLSYKQPLGQVKEQPLSLESFRNIEESIKAKPEDSSGITPVSGSAKPQDVITQPVPNKISPRDQRRNAITSDMVTNEPQPQAGDFTEQQMISEARDKGLVGRSSIQKRFPFLTNQQAKVIRDSATGKTYAPTASYLESNPDFTPERAPGITQQMRSDAIQYNRPAPHAPNFILRKETPSVKPTGESQGQTPRPEVAEPQLRVEGYGDQLSNLRGPESPKAPVDFSTDPDVQAIRSKIVMSNKEKAKAPLLNRINEGLNEFWRGSADEPRPFLRADKQAGVRGTEKGSYERFEGLKRTVASTVQGVAKSGFKNAEGNVLTPSMRELVQDIQSVGNQDEFATLVTARRTPEMAARQEKLPFDVDTAARATEKLSNKYAAPLAKFDRINKGMLDYAEQNGFLSREKAAEIYNSNKLYSDWGRVDDEGNIVEAMQSPTGGKNKMVIGQPLNKITAEGSIRSIANPIEAMLGNTIKMVSAVEKNNAKKAFAALADMPGMDRWVKPVDESNVSAFASKKGDLMDVVIDGNKKTFQVDPSVAASLNSMNPSERTAIGAVAKLFADVQRAGVTLSPAFGINNLLNDSWDQASVSHSTSIPYANQARGAKVLAKHLLGVGKTDSWKEFGESAANQAIEYGAIFSPSDLMKKIKNDVDGNRFKQALKNPAKSVVDGLKKVMEISETVGRVGEYDRSKGNALKAGKSEMDSRSFAASESAGMLDFGKTGSWQIVKGARQYVPFLGANINAIYKLGDMVKSPTKIAKMVAIMGAAEAANYAMNQDDPSYWNEPQWKRFGFFRLPTESVLGYNIWLPKGRNVVTLGIMAAFKTGFETLGQEDPLAAKKNAEEFFKNQTMNILPPPIKVGMELTSGDAGYNSYTNRPIVPEKLQGLPKRLQFTGRTSGVAKGIASGLDSAGIEVSPMKVEHAIRGFGGTLAGDVSSGNLGSILKRNVAKPGAFGSEVQDRFYTKLNQVKKESAAAKAGDMPRIDIGNVRAMNKASEEVRDIRAKMTPDMTEDQKRAKMLEIDAKLAPFIDMPKNYK